MAVPRCFASVVKPKGTWYATQIMFIYALFMQPAWGSSYCNLAWHLSIVKHAVVPGMKAVMYFVCLSGSALRRATLQVHAWLHLYIASLLLLQCKMTVVCMSWREHLCTADEGNHQLLWCFLGSAAAQSYVTAIMSGARSSVQHSKQWNKNRYSARRLGH